MRIMYRFFITPVALIAIAGISSGCTSSTETLENTDIFAPAAEVSVPDPIQTTAFDVQTFQTPPAVEQIIQQPLIQQPIVEQQPVIIQPPQPQLVQVPIAPTFIPTFQPSYDCSIIPTSKSRLAEYRENCISPR